MAYTGQVASRPLEISGGLQTWQETTSPDAVLRTGMGDGQTIKTRRRVTRAIRQGNASVTVRADEVQFWRQWFEVNCQGGALPTRLKFPPNCEEQIWRFATPLTYEWIDPRACRIAFSLEKLPHWTD